MADLSSILGGMVQGFKDFGTGLVDFFGTGAANIGDIASSIATGRATTKNQDDFRKWLYNTDSTKDAAAKGLGTALNGVSTVADVIPGAQAVTANPLFNGIQGAIGGVADELKMNGENADWGRAAQRAGVGAASGLASGYAGQALGESGNKLLSNGLTRGAVSGALGGGIANAGYTGIEGGSVQDMINAGLYGAQTGALVGGTTGLARELIKPTHKMDVALTDDEKAARIANIDDQLGKLDLNTPEGNARYNELMNARNNYADNRKAQFELLQKTNPMTDDYHTGIRSPEEIYTLKNIVDSYNQDNNFTYPDFTLADAQKALASGNINVYGSKPIEPGAFASPSKMMATDYAGGGEVYTKNIPLEDFAFIESGDEGNYLPVSKPKTVADLMNEPKQKTVADLMLSPEQEEFFKNSVVRDENGNLKPMYHGTRSNFTVFGDNAPLDGSNSHASVGHWFTPTEEGAKNFANSIWYGDGDPKVMKTYLDIKNPKIYETVDNSAAIEPLAKRLQELELDSSKLSDTELYRKNIYHASTVQNMINLADKDTAVDWLTREKHYDKQKAIKLVDEIADIKRLADEKANLQNEISELKYGDAYQRFKTDLYKVDGQTANDANAGGVGMALNDKNSIKKYVDNLKAEGYDGIIIKGTNYDADVMGGPNDQYVVFDSNQIKDINNLKPTADPDIMYSKVAEGQLGLFDQPMPKPEPEPVALPKSLGEQASLFDQPKQPIVEAQVVDTEPVNPYAPVDGQVTQTMRDRAADVLKNYAKKGVPDNELYNMIDESTLPAGYKEFREIVDSGKSYAKEKLGAESANKADLRRVVEYLYDDTAKQEEMLRNVKIEESNDAARRAMYGLAPRKSGSSFSEKMLRRAADEKLTKEFTEKIGKIENRVPELVNSLRRYSPSDLSVRKGLTAAADELYSERLGIAPGNTIKYNGPADVRNAYGRYSKQSKNLALTRSNVSDPEQAISTVAHERLHSFQNEADLNRGKYGATNRYDKRVTDAFDDLRKDLEEAKVYKSYPETAERYGSKDAEYFYNTKEQEARMLQQYLNNKGYADLAELKRPNTGKSRSGEFGTEVNAAFDKFFDKLRALSKKGVALPALTALFGGGAIMAATQGDDKKKKSEVK